MIDKPLQFVSGLPRSGSTLLMNLLGQNPAHHVTPTSGLIHLMRGLIGTWADHKEFQSQGLEHVKPNVLSAPTERSSSTNRGAGCTTLNRWKKFLAGP